MEDECDYMCCLYASAIISYNACCIWGICMA